MTLTTHHLAFTVVTVKPVDHSVVGIVGSDVITAIRRVGANLHIRPPRPPCDQCPQRGW